MNAIPIPQLSKRELWLKERASYIGASEVAAILGESPYLSAHELWRIKRGEHTVEETLPMRLGSFIEPFIGKEFTNMTGLKLQKSKFCRHKKWGFMACNPDFQVRSNGFQPKLEDVPEKYQKLWTLAKGRKGLVQTKYASFWPGQQWGSEGADEVPKHYLLQCAHELIVSGADYLSEYEMELLLVSLRDKEDFWRQQGEYRTSDEYLLLRAKIVRNNSKKEECSICGKLFVLEHGRQKYCSDLCRHKAYRDRKKKTKQGGKPL